MSSLPSDPRSCVRTTTRYMTRSCMRTTHAFLEVLLVQQLRMARRVVQPRWKLVDQRHRGIRCRLQWANTGKMNNLVVANIFTKWVETFPIGDPKTSTIVCLQIEQVFIRYGYRKSWGRNQASDCKATRTFSAIESYILDESTSWTGMEQSPNIDVESFRDKSE